MAHNGSTSNIPFLFVCFLFLFQLSRFPHFVGAESWMIDGQQEVNDLKLMPTQEEADSTRLQPRSIVHGSIIPLAIKVKDLAKLDLEAGRYVEIRMEDPRGLILRGTTHSDDHSIRIRRGQVFVNDELLCNDITKVDPSPSYQRSMDGSSWFTNLDMGHAMTPKEMESFETEWDQYKDKQGGKVTAEDAEKRRKGRIKEIFERGEEWREKKRKAEGRLVDGILRWKKQRGTPENKPTPGGEKEEPTKNRIVVWPWRLGQAGDHKKTPQDGQQKRQTLPEDKDEEHQGEIQKKDTEIVRKEGEEKEGAPNEILQKKESSVQLEKQEAPEGEKKNSQGEGSGWPWSWGGVGEKWKTGLRNLIGTASEKLEKKLQPRKEGEESQGAPSENKGEPATKNGDKALEKPKSLQLENQPSLKNEDNRVSIDTTRDSKDGVASEVDDQGNPATLGKLKVSGNGILIADYGGVQVQAYNPQQVIVVEFEDPRVAVNDRVVCENLDTLPEKATYQMAEDGGKWYTNLQIGRKMSDSEIAQFLKEEEERKAMGLTRWQEQAQRKQKEEVEAAAEKERAKKREEEEARTKAEKEKLRAEDGGKAVKLSIKQEPVQKKCQEEVEAEKVRAKKMEEEKAEKLRKENVKKLAMRIDKYQEQVQKKRKKEKEVAAEKEEKARIQAGREKLKREREEVIRSYRVKKDAMNVALLQAQAEWKGKSKGKKARKS
ncbi:unnamed protein product [Bemisia tabaci]|uniref:Uncharacterized protein n=1 Tax=Bemisia tabaci TaxID=7038 RepID=A0A9P0EZX7_BEMTA|nr:unnamed protein product [Bemisia tabaci]